MQPWGIMHVMLKMLLDMLNYNTKIEVQYLGNTLPLGPRYIREALSDCCSLLGPSQPASQRHIDWWGGYKSSLARIFGNKSQVPTHTQPPIYLPIQSSQYNIAVMSYL